MLDHASGDKRFKILEVHMKKHQFRHDALIEVLHKAQELFGYLEDDLLLFVSYKLKLKDGTEVEGMILSKTENDINVKQIGSTNPTAFKRADIVSMEENEESLMPKFPLQKQEMVDLVEYLRTLKKQ